MPLINDFKTTLKWTKERKKDTLPLPCPSLPRYMLPRAAPILLNPLHILNLQIDGWKA